MKLFIILAIMFGTILNGSERHHNHFNFSLDVSLSNRNNNSQFYFESHSGRRFERCHEIPERRFQGGLIIIERRPEVIRERTIIIIEERRECHQERFLDNNCWKPAPVVPFDR